MKAAMSSILKRPSACLPRRTFTSAVIEDGGEETTAPAKYSDVEKQKLKNMLLIMGFNGRNYKGSMYSPEPSQRTVEGDLEKALVEAQII